MDCDDNGRLGTLDMQTNPNSSSVDHFLEVVHAITAKFFLESNTEIYNANRSKETAQSAALP